jgi:hypothetical protein
MCAHADGDASSRVPRYHKRCCHADPALSPPLALCFPPSLPVCFMGEQWPGGSPGDGARSPGVRLCGLPQGPSKRLEGGLHDVVAVLARQLRTQTAKRGGQQPATAGNAQQAGPQVTGQSQGERGGDKEGEGRWLTWRMCSVMPEVLTSDWKKCSTSCSHGEPERGAVSRQRKGPHTR